jgi:outer membrane protein TolC
MVCACGFFGGCVRYEARPLAPEVTAAALGARSLNDDGLHRFLAQNLGRDPTPWPPGTWDFETLTWVAFFYEPSLEVARAQWQVASAGAKTAAARANPTLTVTPGYDTSVPGGISPWFPSISLDFLLETRGKREHRAAIERLAAESARLNILSSAWTVRRELRRALIEASAASRKLTLLDQQVALARESWSLMEKRREAGTVSATEVAPAHTALIRAEAAAAEAQRQAPLARARVARTLGLPAAALDGARLVDMLAAPAPPLAAAGLAVARRQSLQSRADILAALARYEASQEALQLEVARQYPDLHVGPGYQYDLGENKWSVAVGLELPVFHHNEGPLAEAEARRREAAAQLIAAQARVIAEIDEAVAAQTAAYAQIDHLNWLREELSQQAARLEARLKAGDADRLECQNARMDVVGGELALLEAEAGAVAAAGQLEDSLQVPFNNLAAVVHAPGDGASHPLP